MAATTKKKKAPAKVADKAAKDSKAAKTAKAASERKITKAGLDAIKAAQVKRWEKYHMEKRKAEKLAKAASGNKTKGNGNGKRKAA